MGEPRAGTGDQHLSEKKTAGQASLGQSLPLSIIYIYITISIKSVPAKDLRQVNYF